MPLTTQERWHDDAFIDRAMVARKSVVDKLVPVGPEVCRWYEDRPMGFMSGDIFTDGSALCFRWLPEMNRAG